jgi:hypothetical protein
MGCGLYWNRSHVRQILKRPLILRKAVGLLYVPEKCTKKSPLFKEPIFQTRTQEGGANPTGVRPATGYRVHTCHLDRVTLQQEGRWKDGQPKPPNQYLFLAILCYSQKW